METKNYIPKNKTLVSAEDYPFLRKKGLEYIEKLSSDIWTDFNVHDPGITIMEILCYAITDISYRNTFDIKNLLTSQTDQGGLKEFFTARDILTVNPVTTNDFRKLLIDVTGIHNAWVHVSEKQKSDIFLNCEDGQLEHINDDEYDELKVRGFYNIILELDEDVFHGNLNDYGFEETHNETTFSFNLPSWDYFFKQKINIEDWSFGAYAYLSYETGTQIHHAEVQLVNGAETLHLPVTFVIEGRRDLDNENDIKLYLSTDGASIIVEKYLEKLKIALGIVQNTFDALHSHRNLCEDYKDINAIITEDISVCADILVKADAEIEKVHAQILFEIECFLNPEIKFYSLLDLKNEKYHSEQIFNGPVLSHGFIKDEELEKSELPSEIHVSDIINIIMDIEGVEAVNNIQLASSLNGLPLYKGEEWILPIGEGHAPRLDLSSDITFYKGVIPYFSDKKRLNLYYEEAKHSVRIAKLKEDIYDIPVPTGEYLKIEDYTSIQEDFPLVYGVSSRGIPGLADDKRKAQAKQLKAFLTMFDQLLANYLAQLRHISDLLSRDPSIDKTYFYQLLYNIPKTNPTELNLDHQVPEIYKLIKEFTETLPAGTNMDVFKAYNGDWKIFAQDENNNFVKKLGEYTEDKETFLDRRNRFLDHLLARFAEQFTDYVVLMYKLDGALVSEELIADKTAFLNDYPAISANRGKAYNYRDCDNLWKTDTTQGNNVSGYTKRLARITGIENYERQQLSCEELDEIVEYFTGTDGQWYFHFGPTGNVLLKSEGYTTKQNCLKGINSVLNNGKNHTAYELEEATDGSFYYNLKAINGEIIGTSPMFESEELRDAKLEALIELLHFNCIKEGFHLVEHILLVPESSDYNLLPVCIEPDCKTCLGFKDPYSFRLTLVLPAWVKRFTNMEFRRHFEYTARLEAPAHIHVKICWVSVADMKLFEEAYKPWLEAKCNDNLTPAIHNEMVTALNEIKSVYPVAALHDCEDNDGENPLVLGQTILGTTKSK